MHRKTLVTAACGAVAVLVIGLAGPGQAVTPDDQQHTAARGKARLSCLGGVAGVLSDRHIAVRSIKNGRVTSSSVYSDALGYDVTSIGVYDSTSTRRKSVLRLNAVTSDGVPRQVRITTRKGASQPVVTSMSYDQDGFSPRLFADGFTYYAYTVNNSGALNRWTLQKFRNGDLRYAKKTVVGRGYGDLTSLQAGTSFKKGKVWSEYLYATTEDGALKQITVPHKKPARERVRTLKAHGYAGVTELSYSYCNGDWTHTLLFATDPVADKATWTTVKHTNTRPRTKLRGEIGGRNVSWDLTAAY